jgi:hypothetical protein
MKVEVTKERTVPAACAIAIPIKWGMTFTLTVDAPNVEAHLALEEIARAFNDRKALREMLQQVLDRWDQPLRPLSAADVNCIQALLNQTKEIE